MSPTAAMLTLSSSSSASMASNTSFASSSTQVLGNSFLQFNLSAGKLFDFSGFFRRPESTATGSCFKKVEQGRNIEDRTSSSPNPSSSSALPLDKKFQEAVELSCWAS